MKKVIEAAGWIYFVLSLIGAIALVISAVGRDSIGYTEYNYMLIAIAAGSLLQGVIVLLVCLSLSDLLNQNEDILNAVRK